MSFGKRPEHELYRITNDPDCVNNLALSADYDQTVAALRKQMESELAKEGDLRVLGGAEWYDTIEYTGGKGHSWDQWLKSQ